MKALLAALAIAALGMAPQAFASDSVRGAPGEVLVAQAKTAEKIDINRAKADELMTLNGIGEARAKAIIKARPYARKDELVQKGIIPQSVYDGIKDQIIAKQ